MDFKAQVCALCKEASKHEHVSPAVQRSLNQAAAALEQQRVFANDALSHVNSGELRSLERRSRERSRERSAEKRRNASIERREFQAREARRAERNEAFKKARKESAEKRSAKRRSAERLQAVLDKISRDQRSAERRSAARRSAERRSAARRSAERRSAERRAAEKKPSVHGKSKSPERRARCEAKFPDKKCPKPKYFGPKCNCMNPKELRQPREKKKTSIDSFIAPEDAVYEGRSVRNIVKRMEAYNNMPKNASLEKLLGENEAYRKSFERNQEPFGRRIEALEGSDKDPAFVAAYKQILNERAAAEEAWRLLHKVEASKMRSNSKSTARREAERVAEELELARREAEKVAREARNAKLFGKLGVKVRPARD